MALRPGSSPWAASADPDGLERRLSKLEQLVRQQDATIKVLQARVDAMGGAAAPRSWAGAAGARDRSRTPPPIAVGYSAQPQHAAFALAQSVDEFAAANALDEKCRESLRNQPPDVQEYVISQGPAEGRNPSAMVMGRIVKAAAGAVGTGFGGGFGGGLPVAGGGCGSGGAAEIAAQVEEFIAANGVDEKCAESLRNQTVDCQMAVMSLGPAEGRNPSAMVMGRIVKASAGGGGGGSGSAFEIAAQLEEFIAANGVDEKCAESLRNQTVDCQMAVMSLGPAEGRNPSAMITGRVLKYQRGQL